jgi:glycogen debranching enzyme
LTAIFRLPLVETYFTRIPQNEITAKHDPRALSVANNGWIWNADPLQNFALQPSKAYLRREVIVWGDCVKLNYGNGPEDNPWLWKYMTEYVTLLAGMFDGFRMDNCHSTPLHVGVTLLDAARVVNPNLYVCAELFTGSEEMDITFVSRLGISSLIREGYNAWDPKELSRLLYRHGVRKPIGIFIFISGSVSEGCRFNGWCLYDKPGRYSTTYREGPYSTWSCHSPSRLQSTCFVL